MNPGRELDALVAEKVMGKSLKLFSTGQLLEDFGYTGESIKPYSTDIAAAWDVVEKMRSEGWEIIINVSTREVKMTLWNDAGFATREGKYFGDAAPHAICIAALKAVGVEV